MTHKDNPDTNNGLLPCPEDCGKGDVNGVNAQITDTWTISPSVMNEVRMGYTRQGNFFQSGTIGLNPLTAFGLQNNLFNQFPGIGIQSTDSVNGLGPSTDAIYIENSFDPSDVVTLIKGRHILHFGVEVLMSEGNTTAWGSNTAGNYTFTGQYTAAVGQTNTTGTPTYGVLTANAGSGLADFLLGDIENWSASNQGIDGMRMKSPQAFVQDDWKVKPNLTINLGLRWTGNTGMSEVQNRYGDFDQNLINTTGPFAGTAGSVWFAPQDNRTTLRSQSTPSSSRVSALPGRSDPTPSSVADLGCSPITTARTSMEARVAGNLATEPPFRAATTTLLPHRGIRAGLAAALATPRRSI